MSTADPTRTQTLTYFLRPGDPAPSRPAALSLALFAADPGSSGVATNELAAGGYARQPIAFDLPTDGETQDAGAATFGPAGSGGWPPITHIAVCASSSAGASDLLYVGALQTPVTLAAGQSLRVDAGQLIVVAGSATVDANAEVFTASDTRLFSYVVGDSVASAAISRGSSATYRDANGVLQTAAMNAPRDAHYIGATRTLLLEAQAVNLLPYSEQLDNSAYSRYYLSAVVANDQVSPDGAQTAERLVEDTSTSFRDIEIRVGVPDNTDYTMSVFFKRTSRQWAYGEQFGKDRVDHLVWFDLENGAVGTVGSGVLRSTIEAYQNGWYRTAIAANSASGVDSGVYCVAAPSATDGATDYTGDGTSGTAVFGFQLETGRIATSYIPNDGAGSATREADLVTFPYAAAPQESSGLVRFVELGSAAVLGAGVFYIGNDSATGPRLWIDSTGTGYRLVHDNGTTQVASTDATAPAVGDAVALRWVLYNDGSVELFQSVNGGAETSGGRSAANVLAAAWSGQALRLNSVGTGNVGLAGYTKCVVDAGVQSLATLDSSVLPDAPSALSATANGTTVTLIWTDNATNEAGFHIYRKYTSPDGSYTDPDWALINPDEPVPADTTDFDDSGLQVGATYQYQVTAFNSAGESAPSNSVSLTIPAIPAAPTNLAATASGTTVTLTWTDISNNEDGFHIYRKYTSPDGTYTDPDWVLVNPDTPVPANTAQFNDSGLTAGATYHYYVAAFNAAGESAPSNTVDITIPSGGGNAPAAPTGLTATATSSARVDLSWTNNATNATANEVHRSTTQGFTPDVSGGTTRIASLAAATTSYQDTSVAASTTYYYRVVALNSAGNAPSLEASATTPAASGNALAGRPNEPAGMTVMADRNYNSKAQSAGDTSGSQGWLTDEYSQPLLSIVQDATAPESPNNVMRFSFTPRTVSSGTSFSPGYVEHQFSPSGSYKTVYASVWLRISSNYEKNGETAGGTSNAQKLLDLFYDSSSTFRLWLTDFDVDESGVTHWGKPFQFRMTYTDHVINAGEVSRINNVNDFALTFGEWHRLEVLAVMSSANSTADGIGRVWIDGTLIADHADLSLIPSSNGGSTWRLVRHYLTWGGQGGTISETFYIDIDHTYVSVSTDRKS